MAIELLIQQKLSQLESAFMYSVLFKEIQLEIADYDDDFQMEEFVNHCRTKNIPKSHLNAFQQQYEHKSAVWCYTAETFPHHMLNHALRSLDMKTMRKMGFFI